MSDTIRTELKVFSVEKICPTCKTGTMEKHGNNVLTTYPPRYPHQCSNNECKHNENYFEQFPTITYEKQ